MLLHEAVRKARQDLGMTQKQLADLAGVQRKQLGTLEKGGNVTLSTLRKILSQLPNLETFSLDAVTATVRRQVPAAEKAKAVESAMNLMLGAVQTLAAALADGKLPEENEMSGLQQAGEAVYRGLGLSSEDFAREMEKATAERPPQEPLTPEKAAEALAAMAEAAEAGLAELGLSDDTPDDELPSDDRSG